MPAVSLEEDAISRMVPVVADQDDCPRRDNADVGRRAMVSGRWRERDDDLRWHSHHAVAGGASKAYKIKLLEPDRHCLLRNAECPVQGSLSKKVALAASRAKSRTLPVSISSGVGLCPWPRRSR